MPQNKMQAFAPPWRWGIFLREPCRDLIVPARLRDPEFFKAIYEALRSSGYKETVWQFVYPGQIGGLIRNPNGGFIELHVRFFDDGTIYGEIELGRSFLLHFVERRLFINDYLVGVLSSKLSAEELQKFCKSTQEFKRVNGESYGEWGVENRFANNNIKRVLKMFSVLSDWRILCLAMLSSVAATISNHEAFLPIITIMMIFVYLIAPRRG